MSEAILYWRTLGVELKYIFELASGDIGLCRDYAEIKIGDTDYVRFYCVSLLKREGTWQAYTTLDIPKNSVKSIREYKPTKSEPLFKTFMRLLGGASE